MGTSWNARRARSVLHLILASVFALASVLPGLAAAQEGSGRVELPLAVYQDLIRAQGGSGGAPAGFALGRATVNVSGALEDDRWVATVTVDVPVRILEARWTLVPLVAVGTPITEATVGGNAVELVPTPAGMAWATNEAGRKTVRVVYRVEASRYGAGHSLPLSLPRTTASLTASLAATGLDLALIPATSSSVSEVGGATRMTATLPAGSGAQLSWRGAGTSGAHTLSRASYHGRLVGTSVHFRAELGVELESSGAIRIPILPADVALTEVRVDRQPVAISVVDGNFAATVRGRGRHTITLAFQVPRTDHDGLPGVDLRIPQVPVSRFELVLPGVKEVQVTPSAGVEVNHARGETVATFHVAMTDRLSLSWPEAVPEGVAEEVEARANAILYHVAHADEGVLHVRAIATYEITRGSLSQLSFEVPSGVQFNDVRAAAGGVSDWRLTDETTLTVFLDREVDDAFTLEVEYEQALGATSATGATEAEVPIPLLTARDVHRQRGMVALLSSRHLTLEPRTEENVLRVGENQLPASLRESVEMTVAHTFRYLETDPVLRVAVTERERERGLFDVQVDTLVSLSDVTLAGSASVSVNVKSGSLTELTLALPAGVNFLGLSAPSLREHRVREDGDRQLVDVEFTQDMEGQFRIEVNYEQITAEGDAELVVPSLHVEGADVEQGRLALEALAALQVEAQTLERLSPVEISELPQQLVMRTTNPILLAYRYVRATPAPVLGLRVTRHQEIEVQDATIDEAIYRTLFTDDGLAVTTARFTVRNNRQQFLRVALPPGSEVWSATVAGRPETPALATDAQDDAPAVLINIINSTEGFPVELTYATEVPRLGLFGRVHGQLPRPDMVVTRSRWEVFLPAGRHYAEPVADMDVVEFGTFTPGDALALGETSFNADGRLRISVPAEGIRYTFEKLYAGQRSSTVEIAIPYMSPAGHNVGLFGSLLGTLLAWLGLLGSLIGGFARPSASRRTMLVFAGAGIVGAAILAATIGYLPIGFSGPITLSVFIALGAGATLAYKHVPRWLEELKSRLRPAAAMAGAGASIDATAPAPDFAADFAANFASPPTPNPEIPEPTEDEEEDDT